MDDQQDDKIDQIEQALDRLKDGDDRSAITDPLDPELTLLFDLAIRLEDELPGDLPDPAFRDNLMHELLGSTPPTSLPTRRKRFLYDWRFGVAAAALAAILLIAVIYGTGTLMGNSPEPPARETVVSALSVAGKETAQPGATESPEVVSDTQVFPPIDTTHVVVVPSGFSASTTIVGSPVARPTPGIALSTTLPDLPQTAPTWLLTAPDSTDEFLMTLMARIGISGEIKTASSDGPDAFVVNDSAGFPTIHWNQHDAYFRYDRGLNEPTPPASRGSTNPATTAKDWLSEIGFDLNTITYKETVETSSDQTVVHFTPTDLPQTAITPGLGMTVGVGPGGSIQFAQGFWLSLAQSADVPMRTSQETLDAARSGEWYSTLTTEDASTLSLDVSSANLSYLLTRADDSSFLLQPVVALGGTRGTAHGEVQDQIFVSAIKK